uniref:Uncharacterized protein n=1 Tax=Arundo donax TaxID=35708 RepID=A0A0A8ZYH6_ARUDO
MCTFLLLDMFLKSAGVITPLDSCSLLSYPVCSCTFLFNCYYTHDVISSSGSQKCFH